MISIQADYRLCKVLDLGRDAAKRTAALICMQLCKCSPLELQGKS